MESTPTGGERTLAAVAYLGPLVVVPLLKRHKKRFLFYHTRQGLYLFVLFMVSFLVTVGLLYVFNDGVLDVEPLFRVLAVLLLLEFVAYGVTIVALSVQAGRGQMPMLPWLGEIAGEG